jgi:hypothetical protein
MEARLPKIRTSGRSPQKRECELHLLVCNSRLTWELMITEGNKQKRQSQFDPAFSLLQLNMDLLFKLPSVL